MYSLTRFDCIYLHVYNLISCTVTVLRLDTLMHTVKLAGELHALRLQGADHQLPQTIPLSTLMHMHMHVERLNLMASGCM